MFKKFVNVIKKTMNSISQYETEENEEHKDHPEVGLKEHELWHL